MTHCRILFAFLASLLCSSCTSVDITRDHMASEGKQLRRMVVAVGPIVLRRDASPVVPCHYREIQQQIAAELRAARVVSGPEFATLVGSREWRLDQGPVQQALPQEHAQKAVAAGIEAVLMIEILGSSNNSV
jgi:hypothetical protein